MFGGLTGALLFDIRRQRVGDNRIYRSLTWRIVIVIACAVAAFAVVDEVIQGQLDIGRPSDPIDLLADWIGIIVAVFTAPPLLRKIFPQK